MTDDQPTREMQTIRPAPAATSPPIHTVAIILAAALAISIIAFAVGAVIALDSEHLTLSDSAVAVLTTVLGALVGILGTYIGVARGHDIATTIANQNGTPPNG